MHLPRSFARTPRSCCEGHTERMIGLSNDKIWVSLDRRQELWHLAGVERKKTAISPCLRKTRCVGGRPCGGSKLAGIMHEVHATSRSLGGIMHKSAQLDVYRALCTRGV